MIAVEAFPHQQGDHFTQLSLPAGRRNGDPVEVPGRVEPVVVDPHRWTEVERHPVDLLPVAGN